MSAPRKRRAPVTRLLLVLLLLLTGQTLAATGSSATVYLSPGASTAHPYSNAVWWPLTTSAAMGCYNGNPSINVKPGAATCRTPSIYHGYWAMDIIGNSRTSGQAPEGVYAMGAGIVKVMASGVGCGGTQSRGNWLYIDHGNGELSQYGHLGAIHVRTGQYVTARTRIADVGNSGYSGCRKYPTMRYLFLAVKHGGTNGSWYHVRSTYTCVRGARTTWPANMGRGYTEWNAVPSHLTLPAPDSNRNCAPYTPNTPNRPTGITLRQWGHGVLRASWDRAATSAHATVINVELQEYHPTIHRWLDYYNRRLTPGYTVTFFRNLQKGRSFQVRVSIANSTGWSAQSGWVGAKPS